VGQRWMLIHSPPIKMPVTPVAYDKICFLCNVFRTTKRIPGESRANIIPNGDSPFDFPSGEIEHPPPPPPPPYEVPGEVIVYAPVETDDVVNPV